MPNDMYAIVDIETTGGYAQANGITEIAIYIHDGDRLIDSWCSLIDPGRNIPEYISSFTGITNQMVEKAPSFDNVAHIIYEYLHDKIFVAHNVNFDYSFIKNQLAESGYELKVKKLCTVRYSRKLFPGLPSYSLGNICAHFGIPIEARHRAGGDAAATVILFEKLLAADDGSVLNYFVKRGSKEYQLPPNLPKSQFESLPEKTGVYFFHDESGKIVYVGKAVNIKKRVGQHFSGNMTTKQKQDFFRTVHAISYELCATELMALIHESVEIKKHWPSFNKAQKHAEFPYTFYSYEDRQGYTRICIDKTRKHLKATGSFKSLNHGLETLRKLVNDYSLCPKYCGIDLSSEPCDDRFCKGACKLEEPPALYNKRALAAMDEISDNESYAIIDIGLNEEEVSCVLVENGYFCGMGYMPINSDFNSIDEIKSFIKPMKHNFFIRELLDSDSIDKWGKKIKLSHSKTQLL